LARMFAAGPKNGAVILQRKLSARFVALRITVFCCARVAFGAVRSVHFCLPSRPRTLSTPFHEEHWRNLFPRGRHDGEAKGSARSHLWTRSDDLNGSSQPAPTTTRSVRFRGEGKQEELEGKNRKNREVFVDMH